MPENSKYNPVACLNRTINASKHGPISYATIAVLLDKIFITELLLPQLKKYKINVSKIISVIKLCDIIKV